MKAKAHIRYLAFRPGKEKKEKRSFFAETEDAVSPKQVLKQIEKTRHRGVLIHKLIVSPGNNEIDIVPFTRHLMKEVSKRKGQRLDYKAVAHDNTDHTHTHVVIFAKDHDGMRVRFSRDDYDFMRETGDRYMEKRLVPPEAWATEVAERPSALGQLLELLSGTRNQARQPALNEKDEEAAFGSLPDSKDKLRVWLKQRAKLLRTKGWKEKPIVIRLSSGISDEYDQNSNKESLTHLKELCAKGFYKDQVSSLEEKKLDYWIESWQQWEARTKVIENMHYAKALKIQSIDVAQDAGTTKSYSKESSLSELKSLTDDTRIGRVALKPEEQKALEIWFKERRRKEPISIDLGPDSEPMIYRHDDPIDSLRLLARMAKSALEPDDYKRLWYWIFERERQMEKQYQAQQPVVIKTPLGELEYTKHDTKENLFMLLDGYKHKAKWALEHMKDKDVRKVREWLKDEPGL